ncbi:MAG: omptin family outer membrane protease [Desulfomonilaceae bacterium]|nr:omptin family outer membrane protease [Desulfomonilaceae bacterium]
MSRQVKGVDMRLVHVAVTAAIVLSCAISESSGQTLPLGSSVQKSMGQYFSIGMKKYVNSFTSYQFPNPFPPAQDPLSRLEFPIDQWFVGAYSGYAAPGWTLTAQLWRSVTRESGLMMQDSDWDDETQPFQKTIFSESRIRLNRGYLVDVGLDVVVPMIGTRSARPVFGCRYQYLDFTTHDGEQMTLDGDSVALPGDGIDFRQTFYHWYMGACVSTGIDLRSLFGAPMPFVMLDLQLDYALVTAKNEDLHLLRLGNRVTEENTRGHCWHVAVGLGMFVSNTLTARLEADFKRLLTHGGHRLTNPFFDLDFSFNGSQVWSDQASISAVGEMRF